MVLWCVLPSLILLVLVSIFTRAAGVGVFSWGQEVLGLMLLMLLFLQAPHNVQQRELIEIDLLARWQSPLVTTLSNGLATFCTAIVGVLIAWQGALATTDMWAYEDQAFTLALPLWPFSAWIAVSGALISFNALLTLLPGSASATTQGDQAN